MAGPILSGSTPFLSNHDRPTRYMNSSSSTNPVYYPPSSTNHHPHHHPSSSHHHHLVHSQSNATYQSKRPASPSAMSTCHPEPHHYHRSSSPPSGPVRPELAQKPTLPGIASILAYASRQPSENPSSPRYFRVSFPQSSDPVAHALPTSGQNSSSTPPSATPTTPSSQNRSAASSISSSGHLTRRRRSSSTTIVDSDSHHVNHLSDRRSRSRHDHPQTHPNPYLHTLASDSALNSLPSPSDATSLSHARHHFRHNPSAAAARPDPSTYEARPFFPYSGSQNPNKTSPLVANDLLQRRHSDRVSGGLSKRPNPKSYHHSPNPQISDPHNQVGHISPWPSLATPAQTGPEAIPRHVRRLSNASASSSSSVSASASLSSEFGASLNISSHTHLGHASTQASSASTSLNSTRSGSMDQRLWQRLDTMRACSLEASERPDELLNSQQKAQVQPPSPGSIPRTQPHLMHLNPTGQAQHRYQCLEPGCGKTFSRPSSLKIHSYSHTGQKPFKCMRCDRAFSVQSNLKRHQKVHERRGAGNGSGGGSVGGGGRTTIEHVMNHERSQRGGGTNGGGAIEEESGEEDETSETGFEDRMEE